MKGVALFFLLGVVSLAQNTVPGSIDGRVTNSVTGDAISGASVHLYPRYVRSGANNPLSAVTQADGSFRFESVPPGSYFIVAEQSSFTNASSGILVRVDDGQQVSNFALQLKPFATMAGKVVDENGNPVPDMQVTAYALYDWRGHTQLRAGATTTTGKDGTYQLKKIAPGRYFVAADPSAANSPKPNQSAKETNAAYELVRTFYPNSLTLDGAAELDITASQNASDTNIHIQRAATHRVEGKVEDLAANTTALNARLSLAPQGALPWAGPSRTVKAAKDGSFLLEHVVAGNYTLWLTASVQRAGGGRGGSAQKLLARQNIDVSAEDVTGIVLTVLPPVSLTGKVVLDSAPSQSLAQLHIALIPGGEMMFGSYAMANVNPGGSFSVPHVDPGEYRVVVQGIPAGSYVQSIEYNRQDVTKSTIDLSQGGGGEVDIVLGMGAAEVDGTVENGVDSGPANGIAVLIPEQVASDGSGTLVGQVATNGSFAIKNVPPGRYFAVIVERLTGVWQNASFLREIEREGASVDVEQNRLTQVQAPLLSDQDVQQTAVRLGLSTD